MMTRFFAAIFAFSLIVACSKEETHTFKSEPITLSADGPLFEGSNTAIARWDIKDLMIAKDLKLSQAKLRSARITKAQIVIDTAGLPEINMEELSLQITARSLPMAKVAYLNPIPAGASNFPLLVADRQKKLHQFFEQEEVTLVADFSVTDEMYDDLHLSLQLEIEFNVQPK